MKSSKINIFTLLLSFAIVGVIADTMPVPGLNEGVVAQSARWINTTLQAPVNAAIARHR